MTKKKKKDEISKGTPPSEVHDISMMFPIDAARSVIGQIRDLILGFVSSTMFT
ncbi:hypothetical protein HanPSC8_Chr06g0238851 [Helianthus annuus]|nr:hypothetical protein HanPSC8_Chr06g0238851 [Helianthus annuus]